MSPQDRARTYAATEPIADIAAAMRNAYLRGWQDALAIEDSIRKPRKKHATKSVRKKRG